MISADIVIIGGGASGLTAAVTAKETSPQSRVIVLERLMRTGKKIIASGNGKCNLSSDELSPARYHGSFDAMKVINAMPDYKEFFTRKLGVVCMKGSEGREGGIYPRSNSSTTVLNALRLKLSSLGAEEMCEQEVKSIDVTGKNIIITTQSETFSCKRAIIAAGGYAGPSFGTDGTMLRILKGMGYRIAKICPAVAPLKASPEQLKGLKGVRVKGNISAVSDGKILRTEKGEIQFNDTSISGVCVFNLAYLWQEYEGKLGLSADLLPEYSFHDIVEYIADMRVSRRDAPLEELLTGIFPKNLAVYLVKNTLMRNMNDPVYTVTGKEAKLLAGRIKDLSFMVTGCSAWQNAQVTCGGVHASCIGEDLSSKLHKGLYFCGEILDVAGDCGGFNLQWAWSSGMLAGKSCAESLKGEKRDKNK